MSMWRHVCREQLLVQFQVTIAWPVMEIFRPDILITKFLGTEDIYTEMGWSMAFVAKKRRFPSIPIQPAVLKPIMAQLIMNE